VLILSENGEILLSRYFKPLSPQEKELFEGSVVSATMFEWSNYQNEAHQIAVVGTHYVVYVKSGEVIIFVSGSGEDNELTCNPVFSRWSLIILFIFPSLLRDTNAQ